MQSVTDQGLDGTGDTFDAATFVPANDIPVSRASLRLRADLELVAWVRCREPNTSTEIVAYESSVDLELRLYDSNGTRNLSHNREIQEVPQPSTLQILRREFETRWHLLSQNQLRYRNKYPGNYALTITDRGLRQRRRWFYADAAMLVADSSSAPPDA